MAVVIPIGARVIDIDLDTTETNIFKNVPFNTNEMFYSTDIGMAFLKFTGTAQNYTGCTARLTLINFNDGSKVQRTFEMDTVTTFVYPMLETELAHAGRWIGQIAIIKNGTMISDNPFRFKIDGPIMTTALISFDNINIFTSQLTTIYDGLNTFLDAVILDESGRSDAEGLRVVAEGLRVTAEQLRVIADALRETKEGLRQSTFVTNEGARQVTFEGSEGTRQTTFEANEITRDEIVNSLITAQTIAQKVAEKYQLIESTQANRLLTVEQRLEQTNAQVDLLNRGLGVTMNSLALLNSTYPTGDTKDHIVAGNIAEVDTLTVTAIPTVASTITITLNGVAKTVAVDPAVETTTTLVATKIRVTAFTGWTIGGTGSVVTFTATTTGARTVPTFSGGTTGVTAIFVVTIKGENANFHRYFWNGTAWADGGAYQAIEITDKAVTKAKLDDNLKSTLFQFNPITFTKLSGYYASGVFYPTGSQWDSAYKACTPGDMFAVTLFSMEAANMPIATYYDASGAVISYSEKSFGAKADYVLTIPTGCYNFSISGRNDQGVTMGIKKLEPNDSINNSKSLLGTANINDGVLTIPKLAQTIQDGLFKYIELKPVVKKGYYTNGVFASATTYDSVMVSCKPGDKFKISGYILAVSSHPLATFYDNSFVKVSDTGVVTVNTAFDDYVITIPDGCYNFSTSSRNDQGVALKVKKLQSEYYGYFPLYPTIRQGYYVNGILYSSPQNDSVFISCNPGDKFLVTSYLLGAASFSLATFYNSSSAKVSDTGVITVDTAFTDYEITIPDGCYYFSVSSRNDKGVTLSIKKFGNNVSYKKKPLSGLKCLVFGDSISAVVGRWRNQFYNITGMTEIACKAVAGAHLADYVDTVLDGVTFTGSGNTVNNQIQAILDNPVATPDVIIISAITNDSLTDTQLNTETEVFVSGTTYIDIATVDRTAIEGAMRWQVEKLYTLYPNAKIFYASAIQAVESTRTAKSIIAKEKKLIRIAEKMSVNVIKAGTGSGIYGRYEINGSNGKHLEDGLHPNELGGRVLGNYYASSVVGELADKTYSL